MTKTERARALRQAADLIEAAMADLDTGMSVCACCGVRKYNNFTEFRSHDELGAAMNKVRRYLNSGICVETPV